jgi:predicted deacylase
MRRMVEQLEEGIWFVDSGREGPSVCISFGAHGNERPPIDAGLELLARLERGDIEVTSGRLLLIHSNPRATEADERWSPGGVDLNRCFHADVLARTPELYEETRAREIVAALEHAGAEVLVDFHCTVEPGRRFLMQHPPVDDEAHRRVYALLGAEILLSDPNLNFGAVSLDEWMSTRGRVGICYETGWLGDPELTPDAVLAEMLNVLAGLGSIEAPATTHTSKELLQLDHVVLCEGPGFVWADGVGVNLQALPSGTVLGTYEGERTVELERDSVLIFPKKRPELVQPGKPLVYLGTRR